MDIFKPTLEIIADLMEAQIKSALRKGIKVDKVVIVGGFGDSPALKEFLKKRLAAVNKEVRGNTGFITAPEYVPNALSTIPRD